MRVVYFGSGSFSVPSLRAVLESRHEVAGIYTQPARPAGRGGRARPTSVAEAGRAAGRGVVECPDINAPEVVAEIRALNPDVICVVDFGQFIKQPLLDAAPLGAMNLHGSLLPLLRGAAPVQWALIRGLARTGVTSFRIVLAMDAGPIYLQEAVDIGPDETAEKLKRRLAELGARTVCRTLDSLADGSARPVEQDHSLATPAPRLQKADGHIDWSADARTIHNLIRGAWPWPGGQAVVRRRFGNDVPVTIVRAKVLPGPSSGSAGELDGELAVSAGAGRLGIEEVHPAGKRLMTWIDFINGYRLRPGDRLLGP
jgi:methionyl-tRNA formyltransferase